MGKIIAITNQKGGVGKTTTTVNVAAALAAKGSRVLIVDLDPQANACSGLGVDTSDDRLGIYEVLMEGEALSSVVVPTRFERLFLVPVNMHLAGAPVELVTAEHREYRLKEALSPVKGSYDRIFIDCPPSLGLLTVNALVAANTVLIPVQCEFYAMEGLTKLLQTISLVQDGLNRSLAIEGVLMTMFDTRTNLSSEVVKNVVGYFKDKVYRTIIPRNVQLAEAPSHGLPACVYAAESRGAQAYENLAREMLKSG